MENSGWPGLASSREGLGEIADIGYLGPNPCIARTGNFFAPLSYLRARPYPAMPRTSTETLHTDTATP